MQKKKKEDDSAIVQTIDMDWWDVWNNASLTEMFINFVWMCSLPQ